MSFTYYPSKLDEVDNLGVPTEAALRNQVRMLIGDVDGERAYVSDEEINHLVKKWYPKQGTAEYVASIVADLIAAIYAGEVSYSADGVSIGLGTVGEQFRSLAVSLRAQHRALLIGGGPDAGGVTPGEKTDYNIKPFDFGTGMHDNLEAGRQNYGNREYMDYVPEEYPGE